MTPAIALDASPLNVLSSFQGEIVGARIAYPQVLHVDVRDSNGELWRLISQDAEWAPPEPDALFGRLISDAAIDEGSGKLRCKLSGGAWLEVLPAELENDDDPPNWELITPEGLVLEFGPGMRWRIGGADQRVSSP